MSMTWSAFSFFESGILNRVVFVWSIFFAGLFCETSDFCVKKTYYACDQVNCRVSYEAGSGEGSEALGR